MLLGATRFGHLRRRILSWCRRTRISASNAARGRNSPIKAHQINLQRSLIDRTINRFASVSRLLWVCGRDRLSEKMMEHAGEEGEESYSVSMSATFNLYDILVTGIELPAAIVAAINRKTEQYYIAEEYRFRVEREKRESE